MIERTKIKTKNEFRTKNKNAKLASIILYNAILESALEKIDAI